MKKISVILALTLAMLTVLTGCGTSASKTEKNANETTGVAAPTEKITLRAYFYDAGRQKQYDQLFADYNKLNPNVTVETLNNTNGDYWSIVKTQIASKSESDLFMGEYADLANFGDAGHFLDLSNEPFIANFNGPIVQQMTAPSGKIYGLPTNIAAMGIFYNKDMFADAGITEFPKTQKELVEASENLKAKGYIPFGIDGLDQWTLGQLVQTAIGATAPSGDVFGLAKDIKNGGMLKSDNMVNAFKSIETQFKYKSPDALGNNYGAFLAEFAQEKVAMIQMGTWAYQSIVDLNKDLNMGYAALPYSDNADDVKLPVNIGTSLAIGANTKHKEEALKLFDWLASKEGNAAFCKYFGEIPVLDGIEFNSNPVADDIQAYQKAGKTVAWSQVLMSSETRVESENQMALYFFGKATAEEVIENITKSWAKN